MTSLLLSKAGCGERGVGRRVVCQMFNELGRAGGRLRGERHACRQHLMARVKGGKSAVVQTVFVVDKVFGVPSNPCICVAALGTLSPLIFHVCTMGSTPVLPLLGEEFKSTRQMSTKFGGMRYAFSQYKLFFPDHHSLSEQNSS